MKDGLYHSFSGDTSLHGFIGRALRTRGCLLFYCTEGCAVLECNFLEKAFRKGHMAVIFPDTLFSIKRTGRGFKARLFELSAVLTDETTFTASEAFCDWLYEHPVFRVPSERRKDMDLWLAGTDWIEAHTTGKHKEMMLRNQWHNFFIGLEAVLENRLSGRDMSANGSGRRIFNGFCKLLSENCREHHEVNFYADRLCITPYYLSRITQRIFNVSPKDLIVRQLLMEVKALLASTDLSVKEIAALCGFESSSYLGRFFRRGVGMTPREYRRHHS